MTSFLSGRRDSNSRPPAPKAGILTGLNYYPKAGAKVLLFFDIRKFFFIFLHFFCIFLVYLIFFLYLCTRK